MTTPSEDLALLLELPYRKIATSDPVMIARVHKWKRLAAERLAAWMARHRITMPITQHFDWDRLRVNVAHKVSPGMVRWT